MSEISIASMFRVISGFLSRANSKIQVFLSEFAPQLMIFQTDENMLASPVIEKISFSSEYTHKLVFGPVNNLRPS